LQELKIKPLTEQQVIISLDRLTRFKYTEDKYLRVFKEIIASNLIQPKYKKKELDLLDYTELTRLAECILNFSLYVIASRQVGSGKLIVGAKQSSPQTHIDKINQKLLDYEKSVFNFDKNVEKLLKNKIYYDAALGLFGGGIAIPPYCDDLPLNLKWLKSLAKDGNQVVNREKFGLKFPIEKIILVEGITEEILLPNFAKLCECDFDKKGIHLISAGGKNQVVKLFYQFADILKLPIFVLLDSDAKENFEEIKPKLRAHDKIYIIKNGEFEDILPLNLIKRTLNKWLKNLSSVSIMDLKKDAPMTKILHEILKTKGLEFKKAEFAALVAENISDSKDVSLEIQEIIAQL
jgi:hypothetical protein